MNSIKKRISTYTKKHYAVPGILYYLTIMKWSNIKFRIVAMVRFLVAHADYLKTKLLFFTNQIFLSCNTRYEESVWTCSSKNVLISLTIGSLNNSSANKSSKYTTKCTNFYYIFFFKLLENHLIVHFFFQNLFVVRLKKKINLLLL